MSEDRLSRMFSMRENFMWALNKSRPDSYVDWPLDLSSKESQRHIRDVTLRGVEEVFEALQHLKNWKPHRNTEDTTFDREKFLEEWVDSLNYMLATLILMGYTADDLFEKYEEKDRTVHERLRSGY